MVNSNVNALGVIFANTYDNLVPELVAERSMASIPFGGRYRLIDFTLSSMANAGIDNVSVIVRKNYHSLMDHLGAGREWDLTRKRGGLNIVPPFAERSVKMYSGRVDALDSILNWLEAQKERYVILSDSYIAMNFDFGSLIDAHVASGADVTMVYNRAPIPEGARSDNYTIRMDEDGEMRILGIEGTLLLRMNFYEEQEMELLEDIYSLQEQCIPEKQETVFEELLMQNQSRYKLTERLSLPELKDDVLQVLCSRGEIQIEHTEYREEGIQIEGILHLSFLYLRGDDARPYGSWQGMIPFQHLIECSDLPENVRCTMSHHVDQIQVSMAGSEAVEVRAILAFDAFLRREVELQTIVSVLEKPLDLEQMDKRPGIVGHIVQEKEDLWELAKQYMTTVEGIMNVNELENENVKIGDKLLIFKENMSIL